MAAVDGDATSRHGGVLRDTGAGSLWGSAPWLQHGLSPSACGHRSSSHALARPFGSISELDDPACHHTSPDAPLRFWEPRKAWPETELFLQTPRQSPARQDASALLGMRIQAWALPAIRSGGVKDILSLGLAVELLGKRVLGQEFSPCSPGQGSSSPGWHVRCQQAARAGLFTKSGCVSSQ